MVVSFLGRQIATFIVALGMLLNVTMPVCAMRTMPAYTDPAMVMAMSDLAMSQDCMDMGKSMPDKQKKGKAHEHSGTVCTSCVVMVGLAPDVIATPYPAQHRFGIAGAGANPDGIASPPALPPPIFRA